MVIADSSVWITFQRDPNSDAGRELDRLLAVDEVTMVGPVLVEVLQGSRSDEAFDFFASRLTALSYVETNQDTWVMAGELNLRLRRQGDMLAIAWRSHHLNSGIETRPHSLLAGRRLRAGSGTASPRAGAGMTRKPSKVLVVGSGPIVIGQAAEFDYAGTQACKALREEGVTTVLVNSNPATIMTDEGIADIVYIEPLTVEVLSRIIEAERPDGILPTLGGQTGLNLTVELADAGVLDRYDVRLLGTPLNTIRNAEDRELFRDLLIDIGEPVPPSAIVESLEQAYAELDRIGLPAVIRPAYTLGGTGGGIAGSMEQFDQIVRGGIAASPIGQVLLERSLVGWKEIEYEVMRDGADNCITVCNMENIDPMGVHTGDSIVVAPSQTLSDKEYQMLRSASLRIIRALGIEGGCNIQFALEPGDVVAAALPDRGGTDSPYYVIEVNPRVSRSSALASKATGYPIARVAAKIAVGKRLDQIPNAVTRKTLAAFEPALDYCVVKIPRWPFDKFPRRRPPPGHPDEGHRRGDGDRPLLRGRIPEGRPLTRNLQPHAPLGELSLARRAALPLRDRRTPLGAHVRAQAGSRTRRPVPRHRGGPLVHPRLRQARRDGDPSPLRAARRRPPPSGEAARLLRREDRRSYRPLPGAGQGAARGLGHPPRLQDGRHLRRRVRGPDPILLLHLRAGERGRLDPRRQGRRRRQRPHPHRTGHRVRLLLRPRRLGPPAGGHQERHGQLQPGDRLDRFRHE